MKKIICALVFSLIFMSFSAKAQWFSTDNKIDELFLYEVKTIDEFIERFNDDKTSFIRQQYAKQKKDYNITRGQLIASLFNLENKNWRTDSSLVDFFPMVLDSLNPKYLDFLDSNWYAETECVFKQKDKKVSIPIFLHIRKEKKGAKWMIAGIGKTKILVDTGEIRYNNNKGVPITNYIPTSSSATNFVELINVFVTSMNPVFYFEPEMLANKRANNLIRMILESKLKFLYVKDIKYHFYQLPGRIFIVEHYNRATYNNGWLINKMEKIGSFEKEMARKKLLNTL